MGFAITFFSTRVGSLSSLVGLLVLALAHLVLPTFESGIYLVSGAVLLFIVLARHKENLDAMLENREKHF